MQDTTDTKKKRTSSKERVMIATERLTKANVPNLITHTFDEGAAPFHVQIEGYKVESFATLGKAADHLEEAARWLAPEGSPTDE